jgi:hypothetical protein
MRSIVGALIVIAALAGSSKAEEIYRWKDPLGGLHFANVPTPGHGSILLDESGSAEGSDGSQVSDSSASGGSEASEADVAVDENGQPVETVIRKKKLSPDELDSYSTDVSIKRSQLERELKGTESRLRDIDGRLAMLQRARLKNSRGSAATGGVAANAADVLSPEEQSLVEEREDLAQQAADMRSGAVHLRQEVEARLGSVPSWWTDLR